MCKNNRKEIIEIGEYLMTKEADSNSGVLSQVRSPLKIIDFHLDDFYLMS